ncbi:MAG: bifunctional diaminohydroxyphosphoribosylaminopyrimidine deaminase/5-amino-6-(5-phosphoribosylamino)uracil reductase RibD [Calditrichia bacterium]
MDDSYYMKRALELAAKGSGYTSPNPMVGSVIVKNGKIIGEGYHHRYGDKHAEVVAIESAVESVEGATLYCNLEPCSHNIPEKKTPPCTLRIMQEKIGRVVIANRDPNPYVNGSGIHMLEQKGVKITTGVLEKEAALLNEKYFKFIRTGLPFVHLKIAQSMDGRIATSNGNSRWITNGNALQRVHWMRSEYDVVLVGVNTVVKDDPSLTVRLVPGRNPYRVVLDDKLVIPENSKLINDEFQHKTIIFTVQSAEHPRVRELLQREIQVITIDPDSHGRVNIASVLERLAELKIASVLVEGGGEIFTSFIRERLFDKVSIFIAPILIGNGIQSVGDLGIRSLSDALRLVDVKTELIDHQILVEGYREKSQVLNEKAETP